VTKANGRGRGWARKGWQNLSPSTRKKYERVGVDSARYAQGYSRESFSKFVQDQVRFYGQDADEVREELREYDPGDVADAIQRQREMQNAYNRGDQQRAHALWEGRNSDLPEWMNKYHSYFS
jgi:hypothetical protein